MNFIDLFLIEQHKKNSPFPAEEITALHSGNLGDIIYSLPTCALLNVNHLVLNIYQDPYVRGRELRTNAAKALVPLLLAQEKICKVSIIETNAAWELADLRKHGIHYNLDRFRNNQNTPTLHLCYQHALPFSLSVDGSTPWLALPDNIEQQFNLPKTKYIAVALTPRYRRYEAPYYEFLFKNIPPEHLYFIGTENDQAMRSNLHGNSFNTNNFLELAAFIKNAAAFVGNPCFPYAVAEAVKVPRYVELPIAANVYPLDPSGKILHLMGVDYAREELFNHLNLTAKKAALPDRSLTNYLNKRIFTLEKNSLIRKCFVFMEKALRKSKKYLSRKRSER